MKQTNEKFTSKNAAMMTALAVLTHLLNMNYDAMFYWSASQRYYCIIVHYVTTNPLTELEDFKYSEEEEKELADGVTKEITIEFGY